MKDRKPERYILSAISMATPVLLTLAPLLLLCAAQVIVMAANDGDISLFRSATTASSTGKAIDVYVSVVDRTTSNLIRYRSHYIVEQTLLSIHIAISLAAISSVLWFVIAAARDARTDRKTLLILGSAALSLVVVTIVATYRDFAISDHNLALTIVRLTAGIFDPKAVSRIQIADWLSLVAAVCLAGYAAVCSMPYDTGDARAIKEVEGSSARSLVLYEYHERAALYYATRFRRLHVVLLIGALVLIGGVIAVSASFGTAVSVIQDSHNQTLLAEYLASAIIVRGLYGSLILGIVFLPSLFRIRYETLTLASQASERLLPLSKSGLAAEVAVGPPFAWPQQLQWLRTRGLIADPREQVFRVVALLSPFLAGPITELVKHIIQNGK
jgi:hypothetical protein